MGLFFFLKFFFNIIFETENALAHQACVLRSDLEKALQDNASLFQKIGTLSLFVNVRLCEHLNLRC